MVFNKVVLASSVKDTTHGEKRSPIIDECDRIGGPMAKVVLDLPVKMVTSDHKGLLAPDLRTYCLT